MMDVDLSGLIYVFIVYWGFLSAIHVGVVVVAGFIIGRRSGALTGLLMGLASAPVVFLFAAMGLDAFMFGILCYVTAVSIFSTVMVHRANRRSQS